MVLLLVYPCRYLTAVQPRFGASIVGRLVKRFFATQTYCKPTPPVFYPSLWRQLAAAQNTTMKYVLVSGGVISGIGKGVIASSTGLLLKTIGLKVTSIKIDPYMNVDAGTMAPTE